MTAMMISGRRGQMSGRGRCPTFRRLLFVHGRLTSASCYRAEFDATTTSRRRATAAAAERTTWSDAASDMFVGPCKDDEFRATRSRGRSASSLFTASPPARPPALSPNTRRAIVLCDLWLAGFCSWSPNLLGDYIHEGPECYRASRNWNEAGATTSRAMASGPATVDCKSRMPGARVIVWPGARIAYPADDISLVSGSDCRLLLLCDPLSTWTMRRFTPEMNILFIRPSVGLR